MDWFPAAVAVVAATAAVVLVVRGWDVRLVLLSAALVTALASGAVPVVVRQFLATFSNEKFVVPICSAMGFAYVLKHTGCDRHLVLLLVRPLRRARWLLVPGVVTVGFLVNVPLISQTSTAVCLGAVVVPLMRAAGYSLPTVGACLLLGSSVGGELLTPGAPELLTVHKLTGVSSTEQAARFLPKLVFVQLAVATAVIWVMSAWWERRREPTPPAPLLSGRGAEHGPPDLPVPVPQGTGENRAAPATTEGASAAPAQSEHKFSPSPFREGGVGDEQPRVNVLKALVPLVPIVLLFAAAPPFNLFDVPDAWVIPRLPTGERDPAYNTRLIGLAMLVGVLFAAAAAPSRARDCVKEFFAGAGYGFANVVSLIVAATCFGAAIESAGLDRLLGGLIARHRGLMHPLAAVVPLAFAAVSGSGMASTQSLYKFFHGPAVALEIDPVAVGAMVSVGSAAGRTMSPVAAVTLMCATLTGTNPFTLAKRVAVPLLAGITVVVVLRLCGVV